MLVLTESLDGKFDAKGFEDGYSSDSEDVDESLTVPKPPDDEVVSPIFLQPQYSAKQNHPQE